MIEKIFTPEDALNNAHELFKTRYSDAAFCYAAGSIITGNGTLLSDLDLVVIYQKMEFAYRETFMLNDMPIEAFVHDFETVQSFIDSDYDNANASIISMIATGTVIPEGNETAIKLKNYAQKLMDKGPLPLPQLKMDALRYNITNLIDDLRGIRPMAEHRATLYNLYSRMGELLLRESGDFVSEGKHLARRLAIKWPKELAKLEEITKAAHEDRFGKEHIVTLYAMLNEHGGALLSGFRLDAPKERRKDAEWIKS